MPDNNQGQPNIPESQNTGVNESGKQSPEVREIPGGNVAPQPVNPADDKMAIQNVQSSLQGPQPQPQPKADGSQNPVSSRSQKPKNSDPYIKAAENIIEKDKNDPYKEEEDHEDIQLQYLHDRFGKDIERG